MCLPTGSNDSAKVGDHERVTLEGGVQFCLDLLVSVSKGEWARWCTLSGVLLLKGLSVAAPDVLEHPTVQEHLPCVLSHRGCVLGGHPCEPGTAP